MADLEIPQNKINAAKTADLANDADEFESEDEYDEIT